MFVWPGLVSRVSQACGQSPLDVRASWDAASAQSLLAACGDAGRVTYLHLQIADVAYPAALAWLLLVASALLLRRFGGKTWPVLVPILAMTILDYAENTGMWMLLLRWPTIDAGVADVAGVATAIKRVLGIVAFSTPLVLGLIEILYRVRRPSGQPG
jgi:hypothetical protein